MMTLSVSLLLTVLIELVIGGLILWLCWWFIGYIGLPEPVKKVAMVLIGLVALVWLVNVLMTLAGHPFVNFAH